jgi:hypothetical protein
VSEETPDLKALLESMCYNHLVNNDIAVTV